MPYLVVSNGSDGFDAGWGNWKECATEEDLLTYLAELEQETKREHHFVDYAVYETVANAKRMEGTFG